jgi:hypothetical protein
MFEYKHFVASPGEALATQLNAHGAEGWRLHTCDYINMEKIFVVMDRLITNPEEDMGDFGEPAMRVKSG